MDCTLGGFMHSVARGDLCTDAARCKDKSLFNVIVELGSFLQCNATSFSVNADLEFIAPRFFFGVQPLTFVLFILILVLFLLAILWYVQKVHRRFNFTKPGYFISALLGIYPELIITATLGIQGSSFQWTAVSLIETLKVAFVELFSSCDPQPAMTAIFLALLTRILLRILWICCTMFIKHHAKVATQSSETQPQSVQRLIDWMQYLNSPCSILMRLLSMFTIFSMPFIITYIPTRPLAILTFTAALLILLDHLLTYDRFQPVFQIRILLWNWTHYVQLLVILLASFMGLFNGHYWLKGVLLISLNGCTKAPFLLPWYNPPAAQHEQPKSRLARILVGTSYTLPAASITLGVLFLNFTAKPNSSDALVLSLWALWILMSLPVAPLIWLFYPHHAKYEEPAVDDELNHLLPEIKDESDKQEEDS